MFRDKVHCFRSLLSTRPSFHFTAYSVRAEERSLGLLWDFSTHKSCCCYLVLPKSFVSSSSLAAALSNIKCTPNQYPPTVYTSCLYHMPMWSVPNQQPSGLYVNSVTTPQSHPASIYRAVCSRITQQLISISQVKPNLRTLF